MSKRAAIFAIQVRFVVVLAAGAVVAVQVGWPWWAGLLAAWGALILATAPAFAESVRKLR